MPTHVETSLGPITTGELRSLILANKSLALETLGLRRGVPRAVFIEQFDADGTAIPTIGIERDVDTSATPTKDEPE